METNNPYKSLSRREERNLLNAAAAAARTEFESPERTGCPGSAALSLLASRRSSLAESADLIDHIGTCSPCFAEYSRYRAAHKRRVGVFSALACAAAVVLYFGVSQALNGPGDEPPSAKEVARSPEPPEQPTELVLDLRLKGVTRSDTPDPQGEETLPRSTLSLSIYLPIGSEEGVYEVALFSSSAESVLATSGEATLQNFVVILPVELDLSNLAPGLYELRIRRAGTQWNTYSVLLE
jgi:hypothetical protein